MADSQIDDPKIAFAYLRRPCVLLTKEPTLSNVEALSGHLRAVSDGALQVLQDYVLFPLRFVLKTPGPKREGLIQAVLETVAYVLGSTCVRSWESVRDLFSELCVCLCSPTDPGKPAPTSEELKLAVLHCLDTLMHSAYGDVVFRLYEPTMLPGLGAAVSLLLALAEEEKARGVQVAALGCLLSLFLQCDCPKMHVKAKDEDKRALGSVLATFLPGIIRALSHVISGDVRQGHKVTVKAMRVWYRTVGLIMADSQLPNTEIEKVESVQLGRVGELMVKRTPSWRKATSKRLMLALQKVISFTSAHQHWRVRLELVCLSDHLLSTCSKSLPECVGPLLEALVGTVNDEEPRVKERCGGVLDEVARRNQAAGDRTLTDVLSENLHGLASALPRLMRTTDDKRKLFLLGAFLGYLKVLGPRVDSVLTSAVHLNRISKALMQVLELDVMDVRIVEERSFAPLADLGPDTDEAQYQRKCFLYFTDDKIFSALKHICRMLGYYGNLYLIVDHFLELYKESSVYRKQAALVLNEIITGAAGAGMETVNHTQYSRINQEDLKCVILSVIEEYISMNNWHLPTASEDSDHELQEKLQSPVLSVLTSHEGNGLQLFPTSTAGPKPPTLHQLNGNIWQICIQLEGVGSFASVLGTNFRPLLMTSLYPVLEKAGDDSLLVSQSALSTMRALCMACDYHSPKELVISNADYLLNDVSLNLGRPAIQPHAPRVLAVMFAHSDASLLPLVADVVQDVLMALDMSYDRRSLQLCTVLHSLMKALVRWFPASYRDRRQSSPVSPHVQDPRPLDLRQFLLDYRKQKDLAEGIGAEQEDPDITEIPPAPVAHDEEEEEDESPDVKPELPAHVSVAKDVMERCIHLLSDPSMRVRLKVLDIMELCVCVLCEAENELLPMVHRCWPALLQRLTNDDPLAIPRAFRVLCVLGETCGDFLRRRVSKEVLPRLTSSLARQAESSARAGPVYTHMLAYKLQLAVLQGLGPLCMHLDLVDSDLDHITEACLPYLSSRQPIRLQEACLSVFRHLMLVDPDRCWFALSEVCCPAPYDPPHARLLPVRLNGTGKPRNELTDNVLELLRELCPSPAARGSL